MRALKFRFIYSRVSDNLHLKQLFSAQFSRQTKTCSTCWCGSNDGVILVHEKFFIKIKNSWCKSSQPYHTRQRRGPPINPGGNRTDQPKFTWFSSAKFCPWQQAHHPATFCSNKQCGQLPNSLEVNAQKVLENWTILGPKFALFVKLSVFRHL